jgi:hypothetical protein
MLQKAIRKCLVTELSWSNHLFYQTCGHVGTLCFVQFINNLVNQLAAHQFLNIACLVEKRTKISNAYSLLKAIDLKLQSYLSAVDVRLVLLSHFSH